MSYPRDEKHFWRCIQECGLQDLLLSQEEERKLIKFYNLVYDSEEGYQAGFNAGYDQAIEDCEDNDE